MPRKKQQHIHEKEEIISAQKSERENGKNHRQPAVSRDTLNHTIKNWIAVMVVVAAKIPAQFKYTKRWWWRHQWQRRRRHQNKIISCAQYARSKFVYSSLFIAFIFYCFCFFFLHWFSTQSSTTLKGETWWEWKREGERWGRWNRKKHAHTMPE